MVPVEVEPDQVMHQVVGRARALATDPPRLLQKPPGTGTRLVPVQESDAVGAVHREWAEVHANEQERSAELGGGMRARVRAKVTSATATATLQAQQADRYLIGGLIRAVDALAKRVDEIGERLQLLEAVVDDLVVVTGHELTAIRAVLTSAAEEPHSSTEGAADG